MRRWLKALNFPFLMPAVIRGKTGGTRALLIGRKSYATDYTINSTKYGSITCQMRVVCGYHKGFKGQHGILYDEFSRSPTSTVSEVTDKIGFSTRHFNQIFRNRVGLTPKLFCRIRRLQQVLDLVSGKDRVDWADIAIACGYFDQAHFIHDFRMFANCTPTEYLAQRGFHPCHVVLLE
jgi:AraC-like DNA-binding protein